MGLGVKERSASEGPELVRVDAVEISVIVPVLDEEETIQELATQVAAVLDGLGRSWELVFVDDGSTDGTVERIRDAHDVDSRVKLIRFRRNFGKAAALSAGFDIARGDIIITMDGDLQDDPQEIPRFLEAMEESDLDLVSGWKKKRHDPISKTLSVASVQLGDPGAGSGSICTTSTAVSRRTGAR